MEQTIDLAELLVLDMVEREGAVRMETLVSLLPQLSWSQVFNAVDELSRAEAITLQRRGFDYEVSLGSASSLRREPWLMSVG